MVTLSLLWYPPAQLVPILLSVSAIRETDKMMSHVRSQKGGFLTRIPNLKRLLDLKDSKQSKKRRGSMRALSLRLSLRGSGGFLDCKKLVFLALVGFGALALTAPARAQNYHVVNINVPGAGGTFLGGTSPWHVNNLGEIGGWYGINDGMIGSFVRYQDGRIVTFNAPGQGTGPTSGTWAMGLNDQGDTTGVIFQQTYGFYQNFIRKADGSFITFPQPGLCATQVDNGCMGYGASQINDLGMVAGSYLDDNRVYRSFIRYPNGRMEIFDAPGATSLAGSYGGTTLNIGVASVMNQLGAITGTYTDDNGVQSWICALAKWHLFNLRCFGPRHCTTSPRHVSAEHQRSRCGGGILHRRERPIPRIYTPIEWQDNQFRRAGRRYGTGFLYGDACRQSQRIR